MTTNAEHLQWIYNRLVGVHKEDLTVDYMVRLRKIIQEIDSFPLTPCIPIADLKVGTAYEVDARNFEVAIWTGRAFYGVRHKFSEIYMDSEWHYDDPQNKGTCRPLRTLE